jgi:tetratricopeptide (TPR) repeat protein
MRDDDDEPRPVPRDPAADARWDAAQEGAELLREGEVDAAIAELEAVVLQDPENEHALHFLGAAHFEKGRFEKAAKAYVEALRVAPGFGGALVGLGHALRMMGRHDEALRVGRQLLGRDPKDADGLYLVGLAHYARGEAAAARRHLERFLDARPEFEAANEVRGLLEVLSGEATRSEDPELN